MFPLSKQSTPGDFKMTHTAKTETEARKIAAKYRSMYMHGGWRIEIVAPLFDGDLWRVNVG
jgi:hypothetical protein